MPSYLITIRIEADDFDHAERKALDALVATGGDRFEVAPGTRMPGPNRCSTKKYDLGQQWSCRLGVNHAGTCDFGRLADGPPPESLAAVRALSPAVVEELRQMWRADARDEARLAVREHEEAEARFYRSLRR